MRCAIAVKDTAAAIGFPAVAVANTEYSSGQVDHAAADAERFGPCPEVAELPG